MRGNDQLRARRSLAEEIGESWDYVGVETKFGLFKADDRRRRWLQKNGRKG